MIAEDLRKAVVTEKEWISHARSLKEESRIFWFSTPRPAEAPVPLYIATARTSVIVDGEERGDPPQEDDARYVVFRSEMDMGLRLSLVVIREDLAPPRTELIEGVEYIDLHSQDPLTESSD